MMKSNDWTKIRDTLSKKLKVDPKILELISVEEICRLCVNGFSNQEIATKLAFETSYIVTVLVKFLHTYGWSKTLGESPYRIYEKSIGRVNPFVTLFMEADPLVDISTANLAYSICREFEKIEEQINVYYQLESA